MNSASIQQSLEGPQEINPAAAGRAKDYDIDVLRSIRMHRTLAAVVAIATFLFVVAFGLSRAPYYETQALIYVQPMKTKVITDTSEGSYDSSRYETYIQQQLQTIGRADILTEALSKPATRKWRYPGEPVQAAVARLQHSLKVDRVQGSYELSITLDGSDKDAIAAVVNAVCNAYIRGERTDELAQSDQQLSILQQELDRVATDLANDRKEQAELSIDLGVADTSGESADPYDVQLVELRSELAKAIGSHNVAVAQLTSITGGTPQSSERLRAAADEIAAIDPGLTALKASNGQRRSVLTTEMAGLTTKNPLYQKDQDELARLNDSQTEMESEVRVKAAHQLEQKLQLEARRTADIQDRIQDQLAEKTAIATKAAPQLQHAADLAAAITRLQARYTEVDNAINAIDLERDTAGLVHVLVDAQAPLAPKTSTKMLILAASLPLALFLGILAAVLMRKLDSRVYIGKDVLRLLNFHPIAVLPSLAEVDGPVRDEFDLRLVAGLDQVHRTDGARTFLMTGASPDTNISGLLASLTTKMERLGYRVIELKFSELIEELSLPKDIASALQQDAVKTHETLRHENILVRNLDNIKQHTDILFIESLPLLSSAESEFAARLSDVVVLVAESGQTTRTELSSSMTLARRLRIPGVATVLTNLRLRNADDAFINTVHNVERRQRLQF